jgi:hypothetical protein
MFETKADQPQWQIVYDRLSTMEIGDVVEDHELLGLIPDAPHASVRSAFHRAVREVEDEMKRTFTRVRLVGYRMVEALEHEGLARGQHKRAKRRMAAAWRKVHSADRKLLAPDDRRRVDAIEDHIGRQQEMIRRLEARQDRAEVRVARTEKDTAHLSDRFDDLTKLLERHGITEPKP